MNLIDNATMMWLGWIVAFSVASSAATWFIRSRVGSENAIRQELRELRSDIARELGETRKSIMELRERLARVEAVLDSIDWRSQADIGSR